jgi:crotonobetainyl-CoA:carnitine CoA-transferase CaiB-like acyl-CoA transferase
MLNSKNKYLTRLILVAILLSLIMPANNNQAEEQAKKSNETDTIISVTSKDIPAKYIHFGELTETIKNPRCVELITLLRNTEQFKNIEKEREKQGEAKYWIRLAMASEIVTKQISRFADAYNISFICERKTLLPILRRQKEFKDKSDTQLIDQFDLTQKIIVFSKTEKKKYNTTTSPLIKQ